VLEWSDSQPPKKVANLVAKYQSDSITPNASARYAVKIESNCTCLIGNVPYTNWLPQWQKEIRIRPL
jgi:hypothetical protein